MTKIVFIGFGRRGRTIFGELSGIGSVKICGIFDPVESQSFRGINISKSLGEMLDVVEPDLAIITSPPRFHAENIEECEKRGIAVICEKPLATSQNDLDKIAKARTRVYPAFQFPYDSLIKKAFQIAAKENIVRIIASQRVNIHPSGWKKDPKVSGGGTLIDNSSHLINLAIGHFGMPLRVINSLGKKDEGYEKVCNLNLVYPDFCFAIYSDWLSSVGKKNEITIQTEKFDIHFLENNQSRTLEKVYAETKDNWTNLNTRSYFPSKGIDRNISADPLGNRANQSALNSMLVEYLNDLKETDSALSSSKLRDAFLTSSLILRIYSDKKGSIEL